MFHPRYCKLAHCGISYGTYCSYSYKFIVESTVGEVVAEESNPAVPEEVLNEVWQLKQELISIEDIISRLRTRTVPSGYSFHSWKKGVLFLTELFLNECSQFMHVSDAFQERKRLWTTSCGPF